MGLESPLNCEGKNENTADHENLLAIALSIAILFLICAPVQAQWVKIPARVIPRARWQAESLGAPRHDCPMAVFADARCW